MTEPEKAARRDRAIFLIVSLCLICLFLWRFFAPAHEYPSRTSQVLTMAFDLGILAGLVGLRMRTAGSYAADATRTMATALFWIALAAGIGLFLIRFGSDAAWWTGHRIYYLAPR